MDASLNGYIKQQANKIVEWVWYNGTDALYEGEAVCYDAAAGTATARDGKRHNSVVRPTTSTNRTFAGVAVRDYSAKSTGQFVEIAIPGSKGVNIALGANVELADKLAFTAGSGTAGGRFVRDGALQGRGTARIAQTVAAGVVTASAAAGMSLNTDGVTLTHPSATVLAGDVLVVLSGSDDGATDKEIVPGRYVVSSVTSATVCVLATTPAKATLTGTGKIHGYIIRGNPKAQGDLLDGSESGGVQFICPSNAGGAQGAPMIGGLTIVNGGVTLGADATAVLADGDSIGERKVMLGAGTLTGNDYVLTVTSGKQGFFHATEPNKALATLAIDAADELAVLEWTGNDWILIGHDGAIIG